MPYPECCLKGISLNNAFSDEGELGSHVLHFVRDEAAGAWKKQSINWQDAETAIQDTLDQRNDDGTLQFKYGVAILSRIRIDEYNFRPQIGGVISYERDGLENNDLHGNLILAASASHRKMKQVAATLLLAVDRVIRRE